MLADDGTALVEEFLAGRAIVVEDIETNPLLPRIRADCGSTRTSDPCLLLSWIEERAVGVAVKRDRWGYGRELIERALPYSLNAQIRYELDDAGLRCTIALPLARGQRNEAHELPWARP